MKAATVIETDAGNGPEARAVLVTHGDAAAAVAAANRELADFQQIRYWNVWPKPDFANFDRENFEARSGAPVGNSGGSSPQTGDLNLDSLGRVQLQAQLEQQYGITLDDTALQNVNTQEDCGGWWSNRLAARKLLQRRRSISIGIGRGIR